MMTDFKIHCERCDYLDGMHEIVNVNSQSHSVTIRCPDDHRYTLFIPWELWNKYLLTLFNNHIHKPLSS